MADAKRMGAAGAPKDNEGAPKAPKKAPVPLGRLDTVRDRLYSRTNVPRRKPQWEVARAAEVARERLAPIDRVAHHRIESGVTPVATLQTLRPVPPVSPVAVVESTRPTLLSSMRAKIIGGGVIFFLVALILSSAFLFFGQNTISGDNISIDVQAPFTVGGGSEVSLQVAVTNRNTVPVESATLIIEYPSGTQSAGTEGKELFRERVALNNIQTGDVLSVPVKARLFGEENEEKVINISVEYRVRGSNTTFVKDADPLRIKISSSPVTISLEAIKEVSSGQDIELVLTVRSNSPTPLTNVLVEAAYPQGFDYSEATPSPAKGQNVWVIDELEPEQEEKIRIQGVMTGDTAEARTFTFSVGLPNERNQFSLASIFTTASTEVQLTNPFLGLSVEMNGGTNKTISVAQNENVNVNIRFKNTLPDAIYDSKISVELSGNGLNASNITATNGGFYNSSVNTITWIPQETSALYELGPGEEYNVSFSIRGANVDATRTPSIAFDVSVAGRRVSETRVPQTLTNIESRTVRFESAIDLSSYAVRSVGPFENSGPVPPRAEQPTTYTMMLGLQNGSNELADAAVTMTLPQYISWQNLVSGGDTVTYNSNTREVTWSVGSVAANSVHNAAFQISFLPSVSQVGSVPVLVGEQRLRATDRFTGSVVRDTAGAVTTALVEDPDPDTEDGRVLPKQ